MARKVLIKKMQIKRGTEADMPVLDVGEPAFADDTGELYIGTSKGNAKVSGNQAVLVNSAATVTVAAANSKNAASADYVCTGTNDHTVINSAIDALPSTGGKLLLLEGTYDLTGSITISKDNLTIEGMGTGTLVSTASTGPAINIESRNNVSICNIQIIKANAVMTTDEDMNISYNTDGGGWTSSQITSSRGIYITGASDNIRISGVNFTNIFSGIYTYGSMTNIFVTGCVATGCNAMIGVTPTPSNHLVNMIVTNNIIYKCKGAISTWYVSGIKFDNNIVHDCVGSAIYVCGHSGSYGRYFTISNNTIYTIGGHGINFDSSDKYNKISDNRIFDTNKKNNGSYPIRLAPSCSCNYISDNYLDADYYDAGTNNVFTDNVVQA